MKMLFILFLSITAQAEIFKIAGHELKFTKKDESLLSGCDKTCEAKKIITTNKAISIRILRGGQKYINSTGPDVCKLAHKAKSVVGVVKNGDQRAFCLFTDDSMVEMNSLAAYLEKNQICNLPGRSYRLTSLLVPPNI